MSSPPTPDQIIVLGRVVRIHGLKGAVRVISYARSGESFSRLTQCWLKGQAGEPRQAEIKWVNSHPKGLILKLRGVDDPDQARLIVGAEIGVLRSALPELSDGEYYWADLIGLKVFSATGCEVGKVKGVFETGANDVLSVARGRKEILIPAVEEAVAEVDVEAGRIILTEMEGLIPPFED